MSNARNTDPKSNMRIEVDLTGKLTVFFEDGTLADAKKKLPAILSALSAAGIEFVGEPVIERHNHDAPDGSHVHADGSVHAHHH